VYSDLKRCGLGGTFGETGSSAGGAPSWDRLGGFGGSGLPTTFGESACLLFGSVCLLGDRDPGLRGLLGDAGGCGDFLPGESFLLRGESALETPFGESFFFQPGGSASWPRASGLNLSGGFGPEGKLGRATSRDCTKLNRSKEKKKKN
jgi:hypothetical protein